MLFFADFHLHSKYSRAVSKKLDLNELARGCKEKGLNVIGTGDFTHPLWLKEIERLEEKGNGFYTLPGVDGLQFCLTSEVALFSPSPKGSRRVHHVLHSPSIEVVKQLNDVLSKRSNLAADGRPMIAKTSCAEFVDLIHGVSRDVVIVPAHAWTPYFGIFGSKSGYDSLEEAFEDRTGRIFAIETGMSSSPDMNWRLSSLDSITLMSNSDAHSANPWRVGRECNAFEFDEEKLSYDALFKAVKEKDKSKFKFTVEVNPAYGKYHFDGHRTCKFSCPPQESKKLGGICPVCKHNLTIGVEARIEALADRPAGFAPKNAVPFKTLLPLHELIALFYGQSLASKKVKVDYFKLVSRFGSELAVELDAPQAGLEKTVDERLAALVMLNRNGKIDVTPGYDGEYGVPLIGEKTSA